VPLTAPPGGAAGQIEKLGLLTKAEKFGLLSTLERLLTSDPAAVSSLSIPALVTSLGAACWVGLGLPAPQGHAAAAHACCCVSRVWSSLSVQCLEVRALLCTSRASQYLTTQSDSV